MKKRFDMKSIFAGLIVGIGIFGCVNAASVLAENVYFSKFPMVVNGKNYTSGSAILNYMGTTYVSLKELGEITGSSVTFNNNTIYVNNNSSTKPNTNVGTYYPTTISSEIKLEEGDRETLFINLAKYNAQSAIVSYTNNCIYASQVYFNCNSTFTIEGIEEGSTNLTIRYDTGNVEYIYVTVEGIEEEEEEEELEIEVDDYEYIDIDLDDYDADKATLTITKGSSYITLNKTKLTSDGTVKVTGDKEGSATIKIKYDTGDVEYVYVEVVENDDDNEYDYNDFDYEKEIDVEVDDYETYYVDLEEYDALNAEISVISGKAYISLGKTDITDSQKVKIYGDEEGEAIVKIKYSTGEVEYLWIEVED